MIWNLWIDIGGSNLRRARRSSWMTPGEIFDEVLEAGSSNPASVGT